MSEFGLSTHIQLKLKEAYLLPFQIQFSKRTSLIVSKQEFLTLYLKWLKIVWVLWSINKFHLFRGHTSWSSGFHAHNHPCTKHLRDTDCVSGIITVFRISSIFCFNRQIFLDLSIANFQHILSTCLAAQSTENVSSYCQCLLVQHCQLMHWF